ncbi:MAG: hypothetical protein LBV69_02235 [Bacteroidales bacterium]|nr:hypothetical protein [Bacteroidales bacterium]
MKVQFYKIMVIAVIAIAFASCENDKATSISNKINNKNISLATESVGMLHNLLCENIIQNYDGLTTIPFAKSKNKNN